MIDFSIIPIHYRIAALAIVAAIALAASWKTGWTMRGWKADAEISTLRVTIAQGVAAAAIEARAIERILQEKTNEALKTQNDELAGVAGKLRADLERVRKRAERVATAAGVPAPARPACAGASGAELARGDAEFLTRYAALAAEQDAALKACYEVFDAIK